jgi:DNA repair exonuclease SbcCD ATPase subunit
LQIQSIRCGHHKLTSFQPTGDEFRASLKAASAALEPHIKSFEELLSSINDEHRRLTAVERSLRLTKDKQVKDQEKAQDALKDVEKSITIENKMLRDLEDLYNKYPGDNEFRTFLDKRKRTVLEHEEVYTIVKNQLDKSTAGLSKTDSKIALVTKRIGQLEAEKAEVMKEKMGIDTAAKRLIFMSRFMEPGWQARLAMVEEALGEEVMRSAF